MRDLRALAESLDAITKGEVAHSADILMQEFKSKESRLMGSQDGVTKRLSLLPDADLGLSSFQEQQAAARTELLHTKLAEARRKLKE